MASDFQDSHEQTDEEIERLRREALKMGDLLQPLFAACAQLNATESNPLYRIHLELGPQDGRVRMLLIRGGACVGVKEQVAPNTEAFAAATRTLVEYEIKEASKRR